MKNILIKPESRERKIYKELLIDLKLDDSEEYRHYLSFLEGNVSDEQIDDECFKLQESIEDVDNEIDEIVSNAECAYEKEIMDNDNWYKLNVR